MSDVLVLFLSMCGLLRCNLRFVLRGVLTCAGYSYAMLEQLHGLTLVHFVVRQG